MRFTEKKQLPVDSTYYMSHEVASIHVGMAAVLEDAFWQDEYGCLTPTQMAAELKRLAKNIRLSKFKKGKSTPKKIVEKENEQNRSWTRGHATHTAEISGKNGQSRMT